jgi:lysophospholipase L1-like esterase
VCRGNIQVQNVRVILIQAGTNNLQKDSAPLIAEKMAYLHDVIRERNPTATLLFSGIIYRPRDEENDIVFSRKGERYLATKRHEANTRVEELLWPRGGIQLKTWRKFMVGSNPDYNMFEPDGLHLNEEGLLRIKQYLINCIGRHAPRRF